MDLMVTYPFEDVVVLTLNRPDKRNALSLALVDAIHAALDAAEANGVRMVVLRGEGKSFSSGFDMSDLAQQTEGSLLLRFARIEMVLHRLFSAQFVTLGLAHGRVTGAGADLFVVCDRRIIIDDATLSFPGASFGLVLGTGRLIERVGIDRARDFVRTGRLIGAQEMLQCGLALDSVPWRDVDALIAREREFAVRLDRETTSAIHAVRGRDGSRDMAQLIWSAARPGLKERMNSYVRTVRGLEKMACEA